MIPKRESSFNLEKFKEFNSRLSQIAVIRTYEKPIVESAQKLEHTPEGSRPSPDKFTNQILGGPTPPKKDQRGSTSKTPPKFSHRSPIAVGSVKRSLE